MPRRIGFSTGALAFGDFRRGLELARRHNLPVVELSALREAELVPLLGCLDSLDLTSFEYISVHAPSRLQAVAEADMTRHLRTLVERRWPVIVHPDVIADAATWEGFGDVLCLENMDKRKPVGRTADELEPVFNRFPDATFCFDLGHARQVDPTMSQAATMLHRFGDRLRQVHLSEVNSRSGHDPISYTALRAFRKVAHLVPDHVPIVLETVIPEQQIEAQLALAASALTPLPIPAP
jgi:hypothetical protein